MSLDKCASLSSKRRENKKMKKELINKKNKPTKHQCVINDIDKLNEEEKKNTYMCVSECVVHMYRTDSTLRSREQAINY